MKIDLSRKKAVVGGGGGAIGLAIAKTLTEAGAQVTVFDTRLDALDSCPGIAGREVDFLDVDAIQKAVDSLEGGVDILVNAAGINFSRPISKITEQDWDRLQGINVKSCFFLAKAVLPHMARRGGGAITFVSSCSAGLGYPGIVDYCTSKGGINALVRCLACELAPRNIRVNAIAPGTVKTPMTRGLWDDPAKCAGHEATIPLRRLGDPREQAMAVLFLVSDMAAYITGAILPVDGGMTAMQADFIDLNLRGC
jgi:NAD(P)-dependent dehydrogenase (short-subunit alcohol dehydrogenase family)